MSRLTPCNFCTLDGLHAVAKVSHGKVVTKPKPSQYFPDGVDVFIEYEGEPVWAAWLAKLPTECACG